MFKNLPYKWVVGIIFVVGLFMEILDTTIVNVALPHLSETFHAGASIQWIATGYLLSLAVWIPCSGWIGDRFGTKRVFLFALFTFTAASALCGAAQNLDQLIAFRILQGVGGGMLTPVGVAMLYRAFPPHERAKASAVLTIPTVIAPALGPVLGGVLVDYVSWRWIFYVNVPIGIAGLIFGWRYLREEKQDAPGPFNFAGFILSALGLSLTLFGLEKAPESGWGSTTVLVPLGVGITCIVLLVITQLRSSQPMLHFRLFSSGIFRNSNFVAFFTFGGFLAGIILLPFYVQYFRGYGALESGLTQLPQAVGVIGLSRFVAMKYPIWGPRRFLIAGVLGSSLTTLLLVFCDQSTPLPAVATLFLVRGAFMACVFIPLQTAGFSQITPRQTGQASALFQTTRQVGSVLGIALTLTVLFARLPTRISEATAAGSAAPLINGQMAAFHDAVWLAVGMAMIGVIGALLIRDEDAAASMAPRKSGEPAAAPAH